MGLDYIGNFNEMGDYEFKNYFDYDEAQTTNMLELGYEDPNVGEDVNDMEYLQSQYTWGKNAKPFLLHPTENYETQIATKNILGR